MAIGDSIVHSIILKASWRSKAEPSGDLIALGNIECCSDVDYQWCDLQNHDFGDSKDHTINMMLDLQYALHFNVFDARFDINDLMNDISILRGIGDCNPTLLAAGGDQVCPKILR